MWKTLNYREIFKSVQNSELKRNLQKLANSTLKENLPPH